MHKSLDYLCQLPHVECLRCDRNFTLIQTSSRCGRFLEVRSQLNRLAHPSQKLTTPAVLRVEDNAANLSTVSSYLRAKGYC